MNQRLLPADHPDIAITQSGLAVLELKTGRPEEALARAAAAREALAAAYGPEHWRTAWAQALQGAALAALGRFAEAEPLLVSAHEVLSQGTGARDTQVQSSTQYLVELYEAWDRPEDAARYEAALAARDPP